MPTRIPPSVIQKFLKSPRITDVMHHNGTRQVDMRAFKQAITETLQDKAVLQQIVNAAMKQGQFRIG